MGRWISLDGEWHPVKERVALKNNSNETIKNPSAAWSKFAGEDVPPGADYIYEGPDRDATFELFSQKVAHLGMDFRHDPDLLMRIKNLGFKDIDDYANSVGYDREEMERKFQEATQEINKHEPPKRTEPVEKPGGGIDTAGVQKERKGGFGETPEV